MRPSPPPIIRLLGFFHALWFLTAMFALSVGRHPKTYALELNFHSPLPLQWALIAIPLAILLVAPYRLASPDHVARLARCFMAGAMLSVPYMLLYITSQSHDLTVNQYLRLLVLALLSPLCFISAFLHHRWHARLPEAPRKPLLPQTFNSPVLLMIAIVPVFLLGILLAIAAVVLFIGNLASPSFYTSMFGFLFLAFACSILFLQFQICRFHRPGDIQKLAYLLLFFTGFFLLIQAGGPDSALFLLPIVLFPCAIIANQHWQDLRPRQRHLCPHCKYDLRATPDPTGPLLPQCPECGHTP